MIEPHTGAPMVWLDSQDGSQHCSCGWARPATFRHEQQTPNEILLDLARAELHANTCNLHTLFLHGQIAELSDILGAPVPASLVELLQRLAAVPMVNARLLIQRWIGDMLESEPDA